MPYASKKRAQWIDLIELVKLVQGESSCSVVEACDQIRDALADGAIGPLEWEPAPNPSRYCMARGNIRARAYERMPICPPPLPPEIREYFIDERRASHWRYVKIDWERGWVL